MGNYDLSTFNLPHPGSLPDDPLSEQELARYERNGQAAIRDRCAPALNGEQRRIYTTVMEAVRRNIGKTIFVDDVGGAGKTYLYSTILAAVRAEGRIALPVASSGIAALLLEGGRTAHSRFKIPVKGLHGESRCFVHREDDLAKLISQAGVIIWDEAPMTHRHAFEALDRTLKDIMKMFDPELGEMPFGGKVVLLGGDFRQVLPVVRRGGVPETIAACLKKSYLWPHVEVFKLHTNMRVQRLLQAGGPDAEENARRQQEFADFLLRVGDGTEPTFPTDVSDDCVHIPGDMCCKGTTVEDLIEQVFEGWQQCTPEERAEFIVKRAILSPLNEHVDAVNKIANDRIRLTLPDGQPAQRKLLLSADSVVEKEHADIFPVEFLNTLEFSGVPPHELDLQEGAPIILLRNMANGLANGTRMILERIQDTLLEATVATGPLAGERVYLPRLGITPSDVEEFPFTLRRRQFPIRPAFAMTINKSQGQTLDRVGIYLPKPVFGHGQLYVALSRCGRREGVCVLVPGFDALAQGGLHTRNVVHTDVLRD